MSKTLEKAQKFLEGFTAPPPPVGYTPPKAWDVRLGPFQFPDEELDACEALPSPPCAPAYPHDTIAYLRSYPDGRWEVRCCARAEDGRWLEIVDDH